ncbi:MAG: hypothetical protein IJB39_05395 [Alistipes sp.]|nr:hypothetical protein [Alistipes sp.]
MKKLFLYKVIIAIIIITTCRCSKESEPIWFGTAESAEILTENHFICKAEEGITVEIKTAKPVYFDSAHLATELPSGPEDIVQTYSVYSNTNNDVPYTIDHELFIIEHPDARTFNITVKPCDSNQALLFLLSSAPDIMSGDFVLIESLIE